MNMRIWGALNNPDVQAHLRSIKSGSLVTGRALEYFLELLRGFRWVVMSTAALSLHPAEEETEPLISQMTEFSSRSL